ncbi:MAG: PDZ domain-containing protein [Planctomycetes bacterium]|nr:PDZ domain-containing protein [Planctomycetota bacterium]
MDRRHPRSPVACCFRSGLMVLWLLALLLGPTRPVSRGDDTLRPAAGALAERLEIAEGARFWNTVARLEEMGESAVPGLLEKLQGGGEKTRLGCAKAILEIGGDEPRKAALAALSELVRSAKDVQMRTSAIEIYAAEEDVDAALETLRALFETTFEPAIQIPLARALWELDHVAEARDRLVELLDSRDLDVRDEAALALAEIDYSDGKVREVIRTLRKEPSPRGRRAAMLDRIQRLNRQIDSRLEQGEIFLDGTDPQKLLRIREERIRELEARLEGSAPPGGPVAPSTQADRLLEEVIDLISRHYVDASMADRQKLLLLAVQGMVRGLDEYSSYLEPEASRDFRQSMRGEYPGIGAQVTKRPGEPLEILQPIYGGPAARAGLQSSDKILQVDGVRTDDLSLDEIMDLLRGEQGSELTLSVRRRHWRQPRDFRLTREIIEVPSVHSELLPDKLGYIRLTQFGDKAASEFIDALDALEAQGTEGLIIDLRNNPGGRLDMAVEITDLFVKGNDPIVSQKGRGDSPESEKRIYPTEKTRPGYPLVVLVNEHSASASEIVAGALQDFGRARLVGKRTFGKGTVQNLMPLSSIEGSRLKLTVQYYFLPSDRSIQTRRGENGRVIDPGGVQPDVVVDEIEIPSWRLDERAALRGREEIEEYVDRHLEALSALIPLGDCGDASKYPEFDELYSLLDTRALEEDVRALIRFVVRHRLEDARGRSFALTLQDDVQLQAAILDLLQHMGRDPASSAAYAWIRPPPPSTEEAQPGQDASPAAEPETQPPADAGDDAADLEEPPADAGDDAANPGP